VPFRNALATTDLNSWQGPSAGRVAFGRGKGGFVAINNENGAWSASLNTQLPDGAYCELIGGGKSGSTCAGQT
jgi:alpha-amylase